MPSTYSIVITGIRPGITKEEAIEKLAKQLKSAEAKVAAILETPRFTVKSGVDLNTSAKYEDVLRKCGCCVTIEPEDEEVLSFDIPHLPQPETPSPRPSIDQTDSGPPPTPTETNFKALGVSLLAGLTMYALISNDIVSSPFSWFQGDTLIDRATRVGESERSDLDKFKNAGGIENFDESSWRGYATRSTEVVYDERTGKLGFVRIKLWKSAPWRELASFNNLSKSLAGECGNSWTQNGAQRASGMHIAEKNGFVCNIQDTGNILDDVVVTIMKNPT